MGTFFLVLLLGLIPAAIANGKGKSFFLWWIYGSALLIVALPHALMMKADAKALERRELEDGDTRKCPHCAEVVKAEAKICKHCQRDLPELVDKVDEHGRLQRVPAESEATT